MGATDYFRHNGFQHLLSSALVSWQPELASTARMYLLPLGWTLVFARLTDAKRMQAEKP